MKTELQKALAKVAPDITDIRKDCDENPDDWQAWQSEIRATGIIDGDEHTGCSYLGGTWEKAGDDPALTNPDISGYQRQMTEEALEELPDCNDKTAALAWLITI